jgi:hypothetical protein
MSALREPVMTSRFVDHYGMRYQALFPDVRGFEHCKRNHVCRALGMEEST